MHAAVVVELFLSFSNNEVPQILQPGTLAKDASSMLIKSPRHSCHTVHNDSNDRTKSLCVNLSDD